VFEKKPFIMMFTAAVLLGIAISLVWASVGFAGEYDPYVPPPGCTCAPHPPEYRSGPGCPPGFFEVWDEYFDSRGYPCNHSCGVYFSGCWDPNGQ
jgi:hypothetical protein